MGVSGMSSSGYAILEARGVLKLEGPDTRPFLQGLISNDINKASPACAIYATFLTPQGRYLHDFFIAELKQRGLASFAILTPGAGWGAKQWPPERY